MIEGDIEFVIGNIGVPPHLGSVAGCCRRMDYSGGSSPVTPAACVVCPGHRWGAW